MKEGTRGTIRVLIILPITITLLNSSLLITDHPVDGNVVHAAAAGPRGAAAAPALPHRQEILTLL